jgi:hypothetical protein
MLLSTNRRRTADEWAAAAARIRADGPITVCKAAQLVPASNRHGYASASTLVRWIVHGKRGVKLDGARLTGKTWWTSEAALNRFWGDLAAREEGRRPEPGSGETVRQRESRAEAANRELAALLDAKPKGGHPKNHRWSNA